MTSGEWSAAAGEQAEGVTSTVVGAVPGDPAEGGTSTVVVAAPGESAGAGLATAEAAAVGEAGGEQARVMDSADVAAVGEGLLAPVLPIKTDAERAADVERATTRLLALSGLEATIDVRVEGEAKIAVLLDVKRGAELFDAAAEGQVLESLEYLAMKIAGRDDPARLQVTFSRTDVPTPEHAIEVDPATEGLGAELAGWVVRNGRPLTLLGVPSTERKGLHAAMNADGRVTSRSEGEGAGRRMVVSLRRGPVGG